MYIALATMIFGMVLGRLGRRKLATAPLGKIVFCAVLLLLFILGVQIGANEELFCKLHIFGVQAVVLTGFCMAGTVGITWLLQLFLNSRRKKSA